MTKEQWLKNLEAAGFKELAEHFRNIPSVQPGEVWNMVAPKARRPQPITDEIAAEMAAYQPRPLSPRKSTGESINAMAMKHWGM